MSEGTREPIVFKQSYKSRNKPNTRILNQKHLIYIATRPGVMRNPDCGFGLWGKLPEMKKIQNLNDLSAAYQTVGKASEGHTLYRAILSADKKTAQQYGLYERETWQRLVNSNISVIQREMGVKPENFCWTASMHYKKRHPHVHILWWDNGPEPRQEYMNPERFELAAERIRNTFAGALMHEPELRAAQAGQAEADKAARLQLAAMFKEANAAEALDLDRIRQVELDELGKGLAELARTLPPTGRLKYKFLKPDYKGRLNAWLEQVMALPEFAKLEQNYLSLSAEVSRLYGNDAALAEKFQEQARERFYTDLGNETLAYLKTVADGLREKEPPADMARLRMETWRTAGQILRKDHAFEELLHMLPKWKTPTVELLKEPGVKEKVEQLTNRLAEDIRIRGKTTAFLLKPEGKPSREDWSAAYRAMYQSVRAAVLDEIGRTVGEPLDETYLEPNESQNTQELHETVQKLAVELLRDSQDFQQLLADLPKAGFLRQSPLRQEQYQSRLDGIVRELSGDLRLRSLVERFAASQGEDPGQYQEVRGSEYQNLYRSMHALVLETVQEEKGYDLQAQQDMVVMGLLRLFRSGSQSKNQLKSQRDLQRERFRNLSKTAKHDLRKKRQQEGSWSAEL